ncbi:Transcriptional activator NphR [Thiorhodovibrio litoralis]|nr:Transcriptional activator NphR [Thiorhodovibrio litoralis]
MTKGSVTDLSITESPPGLTPEPCDNLGPAGRTDQTAGPVELDARQFLADEGFEIWRESLHPLFDLEPAAGKRPQNFAAQVRAFSLGDLMLSDSASRGHFIWRGAASSDLLLVQLHTQGEGQATNGGRPMPIMPGALSIIDLAYPYLAEDHDFRCLTLIMPRARLGERAGAGRPGGLVLPPERPLTRILTAHLFSVWDSLPDLTASETPAVVNGLLHTLTEAIAFQTQTDPRRPPALPFSQVALLAYIDRHLQQPLDAAHLCRVFGCSRSVLYRLLAPEGGVGAVIMQRRLARAYRLLGNPALRHLSIAEIAMRCGFSDQSHFCRAFRATFALSPSDARQRLAAGSAPSVRPSDLPRFRDWLLSV